MNKIIAFLFAFTCISGTLFGQHILVPMDEVQSDHLKAYGLTYFAQEKDIPVQLILNYRGGSFLMGYNKALQAEITRRGVFFEILDHGEVNDLNRVVASSAGEMAIMPISRPARIAVLGNLLYDSSPKDFFQDNGFKPGMDKKDFLKEKFKYKNDRNKWIIENSLDRIIKDPATYNDIILNVLNYAEVPFDMISAGDVKNGKLEGYDRLFCFNEDFTGKSHQFEKAYGKTGWYKQMISKEEKQSQAFGYAFVEEFKFAVALKIKAFIEEGGHFFTMCSGGESFEVALASENEVMPEVDRLYSQNTIAFKDFKLLSGYYGYSSIDVQGRRVTEIEDFFQLNHLSGLAQANNSIFVQNHKRELKGFRGGTTAFQKSKLKEGVVVLAENRYENEARYIYTLFGEGSWAYLSGHDPEDYRCFIGEKAVPASAYPNSPGYRLILNNIFIPSASYVDISHGLVVYPNPVESNELSFELDHEEVGLWTVRISDMMGREILSEEIQKSSGIWKHQIGLSGLPSGAYILTLKHGTYQASAKWVFSGE